MFSAQRFQSAFFSLQLYYVGNAFVD